VKTDILFFKVGIAAQDNRDLIQTLLAEGGSFEVLTYVNHKTRKKTVSTNSSKMYNILTACNTIFGENGFCLEILFFVPLTKQPHTNTQCKKPEKYFPDR
jgi:hypothetical protein